MTTTTTINRRTRSLGYGWTSTPARTSNGPRIEEVRAPSVRGGIAAVERERRRMNRILGDSTWRRERLWVGDRPVLAPVGEVLEMLQARGSVTVSLGEPTAAPTRRGRPSIDPNAPRSRSLTIRVPTPLYVGLEAAAERRGADISAVIRAAIEAHLADD